jgi:hypothetical protein
MSSNAPLAYRILADSILADAQYGVRFGDRKVFLGSIPGIDLADAECVQMLDDLRRAQLLTFARADLVAAMDPALVATSEWRLDGTTYHFLIVEPAAQRAAA